MKKKLKKVLSVVLALTVVLAYSVTSFAAGEGGSTITIKNTTTGKTYNIYKVFDLTQDGEAVAYTFDATGADDPLLLALKGNGSPFILDAQPAGSNHYVVSTEANASVIADFFELLAYGNSEADPAVSPVLTSPTKTATGTGGSVAIEDVDPGYYFITTAAGTVITIDSTLPDVEVIDKNKIPSWDNEDPDNPDSPAPGKVITGINGNDYDKPVTTNNAKFGDVISFSTAINATPYVYKNGEEELVTYYYIKDVMDPGLDLDTSSIMVKASGTEITETCTIDTTTDNCFEIIVPYGEKYGDAVIEVTYEATVLDTAVLGQEGNQNEAIFTYVSEPCDPDDPEIPTDPEDPSYPQPDPENPPEYPDTPVVTNTHVYAIGLVKLDNENNSLGGAEFKINVPVKPCVDGSGNPIAGVYEFDSTSSATSTEELKTDANGYLLIKGLDLGTYTLNETKAPQGYILDSKDISLIVEKADEQEYAADLTNPADVLGSPVAAYSEVVNNPGSELPETGGIGTTIFYVIGALLVLGAAIMLITRRRMSAE